MRFILFNLVYFCLHLFLFESVAPGDDWPEWMGPQRASEWREDGILETFPEEGLRIKWRKPVGLGYSGPAVVDGGEGAARVFAGLARVRKLPAHVVHVDPCAKGRRQGRMRRRDGIAAVALHRGRRASSKSQLLLHPLHQPTRPTPHLAVSIREIRV